MSSFSYATISSSGISPLEKMFGLEKMLESLSASEEYGVILRAKGMLPAEDGTWIYFDMVPEETEIREGSPEYTGRLCVIGSKLNEEKLAKLFGVA